VCFGRVPDAITSNTFGDRRSVREARQAEIPALDVDDDQRSLGGGHQDRDPNVLLERPGSERLPQAGLEVRVGRH